MGSIESRVSECLNWTELSPSQQDECIVRSVGLIALLHTMHLTTWGTPKFDSTLVCARETFCYTAYDTYPELTFFWQSKRFTQHGYYLRQNRRAILSACTENDPPNSGNGQGVCVYAYATELSDLKSIAQAQEALGKRSGQGVSRSPEEFLSPSGDVLYAARPYRVEINAPWNPDTSVSVPLFRLSSELEARASMEHPVR